jgi:hypothetical protein
MVIPAGRGRERDLANPRLRVETSFRSRTRLMFSGGFIRAGGNAAQLFVKIKTMCYGFLLA